MILIDWRKKKKNQKLIFNLLIEEKEDTLYFQRKKKNKQEQQKQVKVPMNQLRRISSKCFRQLYAKQSFKMASNNQKKYDQVKEQHQEENDIEMGINLFRPNQSQQNGQIQQRKQDGKTNLSFYDKNDIEFQNEYSQQHYSRKRAIQDVVESLYFQDHSQTTQYEFLKKLSSQKVNDEQDEIENDIQDVESQVKANTNINETDLKTNFDSLQNFLEEDLVISDQDYKKVLDLSSSARTAISSNQGNIQMKRIPENAYDILPIIQNIHLNNHLLAFFVKYQKYFFSLQYYALISKLKQNVDDLEYIKEFEMSKYEEKRKSLQEINSQAKPKYKPVFLNAEETKAHFGYSVLIRNIKQKFEHYDARKSITILRALVAFDNNISDEFFDLIGKRFLQSKSDFTTFELVQYHFLLAIQSERHGQIVNNDLQQKVINEYLSRDESEFTSQILNLIIKLRVMFPIYSVHQINLVLVRMQTQFTRQITFFSTKQLLEIAMIFLQNNIHFNKYFVEILFITILKNLPQEQSVKSKSVIQILKYFKNKNLYYLQRIDDKSQIQLSKEDSWENRSGEEEGISDDFDDLSAPSESQNKNSDDIENLQKEDSQTKVFRNSMKTSLKIDGLFDTMLSSIVKEISSGKTLKPYSLHLLINICIQNQVTKQAYYDIFITEYAKILPKASFLMFARMYQILSDQFLIQKPLHILSSTKVKNNIKSEYVSYQKTQQLLITFDKQQQSKGKLNHLLQQEYRYLSEKQMKLTRLLLLKLNFGVSNLWSYVLNQIRFDLIEQTDVDIMSSSISYCNSLIADIDKYVDQQMNCNMNLLQNAQQINNFIEIHLKKVVPFIDISKFVSNIHINIIDPNKNIRYSSKVDLMFQLIKRQFFIKYQPYIERNALVNQMIFDVKLSNIETSSVTLINFVNESQCNYKGDERGTTYLKRHFSKTSNQPFVLISIREFENYIQEFLEESSNQNEVIQNFIEYKLQDIALPKDLKLPQEVQNTIDLFEQQISQIYNECKQEYELTKEQNKNKSKNRFQKYTKKPRQQQSERLQNQEEIENENLQINEENLSNQKQQQNKLFGDHSKSNQNQEKNNKYYQID
ncbi:hypothetical protein TTHERM_00133740 (macronuclear) [Tetrahymena thermophila SB210]|uniref:Uncharacterized protein n=1 Tax=Tetrahymena thermophila (strain SB210) TaxID=312017 RepID=I7MF64_TETTS|nr:hypothetical protein TTHERM_00133740 [Tetrahymena thermophila SB210]EAR99408.3 hypothetical protein TTHERM_00133740 [Tetrahymena thermophila SB210]|eukprot:XP_001019653.3 hypothetical protein TTHERM_00133740 [Tetrahymena thermophila SB210]